MFGYFRPNKSHLSASELRLFYAHYCRVCYCLRRLGGQFARFFTTYDAALYSLIINLQLKEKDPPYFECEKVMKSNMKYFSDDEMGIRLARLSIISVAEKLRDDIVDDNDKRAKFLTRFFKKTIDGARDAEPELFSCSYEQNDLLTSYQKENRDIFTVLHCYGDTSVSLFSHFLDMTYETSALIRAVSEWNCFVDMVCDYDEDHRKRAYNGLNKDECPTFVSYIDHYYTEFSEIENQVTGALITALMSLKEDSLCWNTIFKVIVSGIDSTIPNAVMGKDIGYHYTKEILQTWKSVFIHKREASKYRRAENKK